MKYLKNNFVLEPLIDSWYAWPHLISPVTYSHNIINRHFPIMESYINNHVLHEKAVATPQMLGGPFMDFSNNRVEEVSNLLAWTKKNKTHNIEFAESLKSVYELLEKEANGYSLESLYEKIPVCLRGYIELGYGLDNQASLRVIEPLVYKNKNLYNDDSQSLMLSIQNKEERPFVLSTPRLETDDGLRVQLPFKDPLIDELFEMKYKGGNLEQLLDKLDISPENENLFRSFFTDKPPKKYEPYNGEGLCWRYFGHACILLESKETSFLFDPVLSYTYESGISRYTYDDLPEKIDYVLITHNHQDHVLFETLLQLRHKIGAIVVPRNNGELQDPSLKLMLEALNFHNIIELDELESFDSENVKVDMLPFFGEHSDLRIRTKGAYLITINDKKLLFAADSANLEPRLYELLHEIYGDIDILFLGMECDGAPLSWLYGPLLPKPLPRKMDRSRTLSGSNFDQAIDIVNCFNLEQVYVYAMGQEPWLNYIMSKKYTDDSLPIVESNRLGHACKEKRIIFERLYGEKEMFV